MRYFGVILHADFLIGMLLLQVILGQLLVVGAHGLTLTPLFKLSLIVLSFALSEVVLDLTNMMKFKVVEAEFEFYQSSLIVLSRVE